LDAFHALKAVQALNVPEVCAAFKDFQALRALNTSRA
jgi:hypothetical protein